MRFSSFPIPIRTVVGFVVLVISKSFVFETLPTTGEILRKPIDLLFQNLSQKHYLIT